jgi:hypothetical protein
MDEIFEKLKTNNYWDKKTIKVGFLRKQYLKKIQALKKTKLIRVLMGQRRVGKSYLMRQIIKQLIEKEKVNPLNIFYLNKELNDFRRIKTRDDFLNLFEIYKKKIKPKGKIYLFLDEVQEIKGWEKMANSFSEDPKNEYQVYVTGSNSNMISKELATYLTGRYLAFQIYSFSYSEYVNYFKLKKNKDSFIQYLKQGGLPELFKLDDPELKRHYLVALKDTIILKDIVQRYKVKKARFLEDLFYYLIDNLGNTFSVNSIVKYFLGQNRKITHDTINEYLNYFSQVFIFHRVDRFDLKGKSILASSQKYFLNDLSFRNFLFSSFDWRVGGQLENAIYLHFKSLGYRVYVGSLGKLEVDFVIEKQNEKKYIQVVHSLNSPQVIKREFNPLEKIKDSFEKMVISLDDYSRGNKNGIKHICAWEL